MPEAHFLRNARWLFFFFGTLCALGQTAVDLRTQSKSVDFSTANTTKPFKSGTVLPSICSVGEMFYKTDAAPGANLYGCSATNSWSLQSGTTLPAVFLNPGKVLSTDGSNIFWSSPGGDINGSISAASVVQLQGRTLSPAAPASGQVMTWNGLFNRWEPQTPSAGGTNLPALTGNAGKLFTTDGNSTSWAAPAGDISGALSSLSVTGLQGKAVAPTAPASGQVMTWNGLFNRWEPQTLPAGTTLPAVTGNAGKFFTTDGASTSWATPAGDISGALSSLSVTGLQGKAVAPTAPLAGQSLVWNGATNRWEPQTVSGGSGSGAALPFLTLASYGCAGDGVTDDSNCVQNAFNAVSSATNRFGNKLWLPAGTYKLTRSITMTNISGAVVEGAGDLTIFRWAGPSNVPMFDCQNCRDSRFQDFSIRASSAAPLQIGIDIENVSSSYVDPGHNMWMGISMYGSDGGITSCFAQLQGAGGDANNDFQFYVNDRCSNYSGAAWVIGHSQALANIFQNNQCYYGKACIAGSIDASAGAKSNFYWYGGFGSGNTVADFFVGPSQQGIRIADFSAEGSTRFLVTDGPSSATLGITVSNLRWASYNLASDGKFIIYHYPGPFVLEHSTKIGDSYGKNLVIEWVYITGGAKPTFTVQNTTLVAANTSLASLFPIKVPTRSADFNIQNSDTAYTTLDIEERGMIPVETATNYQANVWENYIGVTDTSAPRTISMPNIDFYAAELVVGHTVTIKDESGGAGTNPITISILGTGAMADGATSILINTNYGSKTLRYLGNKKFAVI